MVLEVIAISLTDAKDAQEAGADRIELVTGIGEGGLTPSYGMIEQVCGEINIPVNVMIRPHSRSFDYNPDDVKTMVKDIQVCKKLGASGIVIGALTKDRSINQETLNRLIDASDGLDITFHRAFDEVLDPIRSLEILMSYKEISRILTSGGKNKVPDAVIEIQSLIQQSANSHIEIMPGSGLTRGNLSQFMDQVNISEVHFGSGVRHQLSFSEFIDPNKIKSIKEIMKSFS
ncbi:copper homeostasis protein CutC [Metabacillus halosaccharovorans]|uniref:PF03932 family protein CutC n=1 Tax=Metabacillus halosaccharovorans TaxID=930124 RepID=A0ABT3DGA2_9BACI|nr:copper homeostasis protein CutC [Metabacillus halosaccharovorans]MCV9885561.1 copper homeostasis protein CutC [Metabacillus halosaccharovorans]